MTTNEVKSMYIFGKRLSVWKWGFSFNEGGNFVLVFNTDHILFYLFLGIKKKVKKCEHGVPNSPEYYCEKCVGRSKE